MQSLRIASHEALWCECHQLLGKHPSRHHVCTKFHWLASGVRSLRGNETCIKLNSDSVPPRRKFSFDSSPDKVGAVSEIRSKLRPSYYTALHIERKCRASIYVCSEELPGSSRCTIRIAGIRRGERFVIYQNLWSCDFRTALHGTFRIALMSRWAKNGPIRNGMREAWKHHVPLRRLGRTRCI